MQIRSRFWIPLLVLGVWLTYLPSLPHRFVWDDADYIVNNERVRSLRGLADIWLKAPPRIQYYPLTSTAFWAQYRLFGLKPAGYRAVNITLHAVAAVLLGLLLLRLGFSAAWLGAGLFSIPCKRNRSPGLPN
jgi:protein O-mannosyl-transferase